MTDLPIRPEAITAVEKAVERKYKGGSPTMHDNCVAAIAAFCEAEGLKVERMDWIAGTGSIPQRRLVSAWRDIEDA
jgi:hypothetical protein